MTANRRRQTSDSATTDEAPTKKASATKSPGTKSAAKKAPAKKAPAKKASAQQAPAKKTPAKNSPAEKASAEKAPDQKAPDQKAPDEAAPAEKAPARSGTSAAKKSEGKTSATSKVTSISSRTRTSAPRAESRPRTSALEVAGTAAEQLSRLTGKRVEGVTGIESDDDAWRVTVEILELRRIPDSTDVLALYEVDADEKGNLLGYRRLRRYSRGSAGED